MRYLPILLVASLAGCSGMNRGGQWPTLAPRPGEASTMMPATTVAGGNCCAGAVADTPAAAPVAQPLPPVPADADTRLAAIEAAVAAIESQYPPQRRNTAAALAAARGQPDDSNAATEAQLQVSRLEALFQPLARQTRALDALEDDLAGKADAAALLSRVADLRERIVRLDAERS